MGPLGLSSGCVVFLNELPGSNVALLARGGLAGALYGLLTAPLPTWITAARAR